MGFHERLARFDSNVSLDVPAVTTSTVMSQQFESAAQVATRTAEVAAAQVRAASLNVGNTQKQVQLNWGGRWASPVQIAARLRYSNGGSVMN